MDVRHKSRVYYVSRVIRLHSFFACFYKSLHSHAHDCHKTFVSGLHLFQTFVVVWDGPTLYDKRVGSSTSPANHNTEDAGDGAYGL